MRTTTQYEKFKGPFRADIKEDAPPQEAVLHLQRFGGPGEIRVFFKIPREESEHHRRIDVRQKHTYHSPTGMEFGYGGSGPADLALNTLAFFVDLPTAWRLHQDFKTAFLAPASRDGAEIPVSGIYDWLLDRFSEWKERQ